MCDHLDMCGNFGPRSIPFAGILTRISLSAPLLTFGNHSFYYTSRI